MGADRLGVAQAGGLRVGYLRYSPARVRPVGASLRERLRQGRPTIVGAAKPPPRPYRPTAGGRSYATPTLRPPVLSHPFALRYALRAALRSNAAPELCAQVRSELELRYSASAKTLRRCVRWGHPP